MTDSAAETAPPDWVQQRTAALEAWPQAQRDVAPTAGSVWCAVPAPWWRSWLAYTSAADAPSDSAGPRVRPEALDTSTLVDTDVPETHHVPHGAASEDGCQRVLRRHLRERVDFVFVPRALWTLLAAWYPCARTLPVCRHAIVAGEGSNATCAVEAFPVVVRTTHFGDTEHGAVTLVASRKALAAEVKDAALAIYDTQHKYKPSCARLWVLVPRFSEEEEEEEEKEEEEKEEQEDGNGEEATKKEQQPMDSPSHQKPEETGTAAASSTAAESLDGSVVVSTSPEQSSPTQEQQRRRRRTRTGMREALIQNERDTLEELCLAEGAEFVLETQDLRTGKWPMTDTVAAAGAAAAPKLSWWRRFVNWFTMSDSFDDEMLDAADPAALQRHPAGVCGLTNLGNTCFMSSGIQCLSNTPALRDYFLSGEYKRHINRQNTMGTKGQLAEAFGALVTTLWSRRYASVAPRALRRTLAKWAPRFAGYQQQDSQEMLSYLLDGLHEDLNEITRKPYVEAIDCGDGSHSEAEAAVEAWAGYERRNKSRIEELFHGQLRSTITCPDCGRQSITFDPFMYLSVPIPTESHEIIEAVVYPYTVGDTHTPTLYAVKLRKPCTVLDVKIALEPLCDIPACRLHFSVVHQSKIYMFFDDSTSTHPARSDDHYIIYELPPTPEEKEKEESNSNVTNGETVEKEQVDGSEDGQESNGDTLKQTKEEPAKDETQQQLPPTTEEEKEKKDEESNSNVPNGETTVKEQVNGSEDDQENNSGTPKQTKEEPAKDEKKDDVLKVAVKQRYQCRFVHRTTTTRFPELTGIPFVVCCDETTTGAEVYRQAWERCRRIYLRKNALAKDVEHILKNTADLLSGEKEEAEERPLLHPGHTEAADGSCEYPFVVTMTTPSFLECAQCEPSKKCCGCVVPCNDSVLPWQKLCVRGSVVCFTVDWCKECEKANENLAASTTTVNRHHSVVELRALKKKRYTLDDCISGFLRAEQLDESEEWYCSQCKAHKRALKKIDLWKLPRVLIIHLKRFCFTAVSHTKLHTEIEMPPEGVLSLKPFVIGPDDGNAEQYRLYAVSNHIGGVSCGHYTAHCLNSTTGKWYLFNDQFTRRVPYTDVNGSTAYILFFERMSKATAQQQQQQQQH